MTTPRVAMLIRFLTDDLRLSAEELRSLRDETDKALRRHVDDGSGAARRTLYLPGDPLDEL